MYIIHTRLEVTWSHLQVMQPALEANDVTVQIKACGLSRIDIKVGATSLPAVKVTLCCLYSMQTLSQVVPNVDQIPVGNEISGVVTKGKGVHLLHHLVYLWLTLEKFFPVGEAVKMFSIGDEVTGICVKFFSDHCNIGLSTAWLQ